MFMTIAFVFPLSNPRLLRGHSVLFPLPAGGGQEVLARMFFGPLRPRRTGLPQGRKPPEENPASVQIFILLMHKFHMDTSSLSHVC